MHLPSCSQTGAVSEKPPASVIIENTENHHQGQLIKKTYQANFGAARGRKPA